MLYNEEKKKQEDASDRAPLSSWPPNNSALNSGRKSKLSKLVHTGRQFSMPVDDGDWPSKHNRLKPLQNVIQHKCLLKLCAYVYLVMYQIHYAHDLFQSLKQSCGLENGHLNR